MTNNINDYQVKSDKAIKSDNTIVNEADGYNSDGSQNVKISGRAGNTTQTQTNVSIAGNSSNTQSTWMDLSGYSDLQLTVTNDAVTTHYATIYWSHDGINTHGTDVIIPSGTTSGRTATIKIRARWAKVVLSNADTAQHTMNAWVYLTA